jgi:hypothetical protein
MARESLSPNRQFLVAAPTWFGSFLALVALSLAPPGNSQMLMNLAPQALPNSPVGPTFSGSLDAVKQRLNTPVTGPTRSQPPQAVTPDATRRQTPKSSAAMTKTVAEVCELKVSQMNDIQHRKVVRVHSGPCLMVFNAND